MAQVKPDPDAMYIKQDPDSKDVVLDDIDDEDIYEDAGDLDFSASGQNVWLSRLPRQLWQHWMQLDDDEEIEIGTMRIEGEPGDLKRVSLRLHDRSDNQDIPKDYTLQKSTVNSEKASHMTQNTYVFTEKDIPGADKGMAVFGEGRSVLYEHTKREARRREQGKKWEPYVRKTVPKQTALVGRVSEEFNCLPVENEEFQRISEQRALDALKPKKEVVYMERLPGSILQAQHMRPTDKGTFVQAARPLKSKPQENKATRMPQNELLDRIFDCFRRYSHWRTQDLREQLQQPEQYLKQTLELVAHMVKTGDFSGTWALKPEAQQSNYALLPKAEMAPTGGNFDDASDDDPTASGMATEPDDVQFENA
ncbi:hypothetical protein N7492_001379 [Penicillium capsulatum]|uniref:Transcription initiation factor IIF subunit beta n=1 Tax=Penicillium capsulatum TaxID=69766 RepID=A0A9W9IRE3_9EURO|nr:hypothetical protein N7492_001379 [Penicillium capsulatum]KAJ6129568.1 hypothetical protein N7512_002348 [Penicillium capsulatum]